MANFTDLVKAQRESGKGVIGSLSGAYNQQNMQKFDVRNKLFSRSGLATALFPGLKGYQAQPISSKASGSMISPALSNSPTALSSIAKDARISARNSMALPSIARNMARMVKLMGGTPAKYFDTAAEKETAKEAKFGGSSKGGGILGKGAASGGSGIMGMLGGALGSIGSVAGSILGGIGSLLGGAASGIFGVLSSALGGMGFMGILAAGAIGFVLYQIYKSLDFSKLGSGLGNAFSGIRESLSKLFGDVDNATGGRLGKFVDDTQKLFTKTANRIAASMETALTLFQDLGTAVIKDMYGFIYNIFKENQGKVLGMITIGALAAFAGVGGLKGTLVAAAIGAAMSAYGALTSEKSLDEMKTDLENTKKSKSILEEQIKTPNMPPAFYESRQKGIVQYNEKIKRQESEVKEKGERTSNTQAVINRLNAEGISSEFNKNLEKREAGSPTPAGASSGANLLDMIGAKEGGKMGYDAANKGKAGDLPGGYPGLSKLTVGQVMALQAKGEIKAAGKYQIIPKTLAGLVSGAYGKDVVKPDETFSPAVQDKMATALINWRLKRGGNDPIRQQFELSQEFAAIENPYSGKSTYDGLAGNKSSISTNQMQLALRGEGSGGGGSAPSAPSKTPSGDTPSVGSSLMAGLAEPLQQLDKFLGGKLGLGSVNVADMLRDLSNETKENPMFIDNSNKNISNGGMSDSSSVAANAWNKDILDAIIGRQTA